MGGARCACAAECCGVCVCVCIISSPTRHQRKGFASRRRRRRPKGSPASARAARVGVGFRIRGAAEAGAAHSGQWGAGGQHLSSACSSDVGRRARRTGLGERRAAARRAWRREARGRSVSPRKGGAAADGEQVWVGNLWGRGDRTEFGNKWPSPAVKVVQAVRVRERNAFSLCLPLGSCQRSSGCPAL